MILRIERKDGTKTVFSGILTWRYNPARGALVVHKRTEPDKISCPQIYKLPVETLQALTAEPDEQ